MFDARKQLMCMQATIASIVVNNWMILSVNENQCVVIFDRLVETPAAVKLVYAVKVPQLNR